LRELVQNFLAGRAKFVDGGSIRLVAACHEILKLVLQRWEQKPQKFLKNNHWDRLVVLVTPRTGSKCRDDAVPLATKHGSRGANVWFIRTADPSGSRFTRDGIGRFLPA
jgi:hypothetical protein